MRKIRLLTLMFLLIVGLVACGADGDHDPISETDANDETLEHDFTPVTVETKFGDVVINEMPTRIVVLGWGDAETVLALGGEPVGASDWLGFGDAGVGPWLEGVYDVSPTLLGTMELDYEQIAALAPDLILDVRSSGDEERFNRLSEIATTVGVPVGGDGFLTTYEQQVEMIAQALGKSDVGAQLLQDVEFAFEQARTEFPEFANQTVAIGAFTSEEWGAYVTGDARADFMTSLGFTNKQEIEALAAGNFYIPIADEMLELLDADLTVVVSIFVDSNEVYNHVLFQSLPSVEAGRYLVIDGVHADAFSMGTVPALLWVIEQLPPMFAEVLMGR